MAAGTSYFTEWGQSKGWAVCLILSLRSDPFFVTSFEAYAASTRVLHIQYTVQWDVLQGCSFFLSARLVFFQLWYHIIAIACHAIKSFLAPFACHWPFPVSNYGRIVLYLKASLRWLMVSYRTLATQGEQLELRNRFQKAKDRKACNLID